MPTTITWLGHNAWSIESGSHKLLLDPFLDDNPVSPVKAADVKVDTILLSHGHGDHLGDTVAIARRTGATIVTNFELSVWLVTQGIDPEKVIGMNLGGGVTLPFGHVKMTIAHHSSSLPDGTYAGVAMGMVLTLEAKRIYFACDTALFSDMVLIGKGIEEEGPLSLAVLPIGDLWTMGPADAVHATKYLSPQKVLPCHYNTFPPIEQDPAAWAEQIRQQTRAEPVVLQPGESLKI